MDRDELIEHGIAIYRVGDVYDEDQNGMPIPPSEKAKWFVSARIDSPLAATVQDIPDADTEDEAWALAAEHLRAALGKS